MKLFLITRPGDDADWDEFIGAVVCAEDEADARTIHPGGELYQKTDNPYPTWIPAEEVVVKELGQAATDIERGVVLDSFKAG